MNLIDVSEFQGRIDFNKVKNDGITGVIIRAGYGKGNPDEQFQNNMEGAIAAGLNIGVYWFSYAYTVDMAIKEAEYCHKAIVQYIKHINLPVFFDWEYDSMDFANRQGVYPDRQLITDMNANFCMNIQSKGYKAGYYVNYDYSKNYVDCDRLSGYYKWYAQYTKKQQKDNYIWQYTDKGRVSGIDGNVDMNVMWEEPDEKPAPPEKSINELAIEVIDGKYGNDAEREAALGDKYNAVQERVNYLYKMAYEVLDGVYGDDDERVVALGDDYNDIQHVVNLLYKEPVYKAGYRIGGKYRVIAEKGLNIRTGAGMDFSKIGMAPYGTEVTINDIKETGGEVWADTDKGWMCAVGRGKYIG